MFGAQLVVANNAQCLPPLADLVLEQQEQFHGHHFVGYFLGARK
jgi:hypothetical protein